MTSSLVEKVLKEPTEENLLELFERMKKAGVFKDAVRIAMDFVENAIEAISSLPFDSKDVIKLVSDYCLEFDRLLS